METLISSYHLRGGKYKYPTNRECSLKNSRIGIANSNLTKLPKSVIISGKEGQ